MSVKLSELLDHGLYRIEDRAEELRRADADEDASEEESFAVALRAIAPALVAAMKDAVERHIEVDDWNLCPACRFEHILEEAGVTCE